MVVIHVKGESENQEFLYECSSAVSIDEITDSITQIASLQSKIQTLLANDRLKDVLISLDRILSEAESYASKDQVMYKRSLSAHILRDHIRSIEKEVKVAHSKGLIEDDSLLQRFSADRSHEGTQLWWAGKELVRGKKLSEYIGENDKTKIIVRLKSTCSDQQPIISFGISIFPDKQSESRLQNSVQYLVE